MMAIVMSGGVYCPLSSGDPYHRQHLLLQQTQSRLILVHWLTKTQFQNYTMIVDINEILINNQQEEMTHDDIDRLTNIVITPDSIAYIIFTSGSTGRPKPVSTHSISFLMNISLKSSVLDSNSSSKSDQLSTFFARDRCLERKR